MRFLLYHGLANQMAFSFPTIASPANGSMEGPHVKTSQSHYERPAEILQNLIRFDTTNPPGNERPCIEYH